MANGKAPSPSAPAEADPRDGTGPDGARAMRLREVAGCPVCGGEGRVFHSGLRDGLFGVEGEWSLDRCANEECGLIWLNPAPVEEDLGLAYGTYYTHGPAAGIWRWRLLLAAYRAVWFLPACFLGLAGERRRYADRYLAGLPPGRLLDVGCGDGGYLARMRSRGWEVEGVDFDPAAVAAAREIHGLEVRRGELIEAGFAAQRFDAITLSHVIEHVPRPTEVLAECRRVLRPGGQLVVVTPNAASFGHQWFGSSWRGLEPPRHLQVFTPESLAASARAAGFDRCETSSTSANAETIFSGSLGIQRQQTLVAGGVPQAHAGRALRALWMQQRSRRLMRREPMRGEELILLGG